MFNVSELVSRLGDKAPADIRILTYILEHVQPDSLFIGTREKIAEDLQLSISTVNRAVGWLKENKIIESYQNGVLKVLPEFKKPISRKQLYNSSEFENNEYVAVAKRV